jgi:hypothetical protein
VPDRLRDFLSRHVTHMLEGMTFGDWLRLLRRHRFAVDPRYYHRAAFQTAVALSNSVNARLERRLFGREVDATEVPPPLFVLGHYRSGTTHLHNLLALDPRLAYPNVFQTFNPHIFLLLERRVGPVADRLLVRRRFQDDVAIGVAVPEEDEVALCTLTGLSPYLDWVFPRDGEVYRKYLTFRGVPPDEVARWSAAFTAFLKKLTFKYGGRPAVLKSPPHTARIRLLLETFPGARFVHIRRNPYDVFASTGHLWRKVLPVVRLQHGPPPDADEPILSIYTEMHDAFFEERGLIPPGRFCEVGYEDLDRDPVGVLRSVYGALGMDGFEGEVRPRVEAYLASISGFRKNRHAELPEALRQRIAREWRRSFEAWGYPV